MPILKSSYEKFSRIARKATLPSDSEEVKVKKGVLTVVATIIPFLAIFWSISYVLLGKPWSGAIPGGYAVISFISIAYYFRTKKFEFFRFSQLTLIFCLPFLLMWSLGGFANSSVVMVWAFFTPLAALLFSDVKHANKWLAAFLFFTVVSAFIDDIMANTFTPLNPTAIKVFFVLNMGFGFATVYIVLNYFVKELDRSHQVALEAKKDLEESNEKLQKNEAKILQLMMTDWLTGVANRRHLDERLQSEIDRVRRYGSTLSVIMTDLDHFKQVNDTYGHIKGDEVINIFTRVLTDRVRAADFVARFGGEEFLVMLPETDLEGAEQLANRIRISMETKNIEGISHPVTASFGVTEVQDGDDVNDILQRVDQALYEAKSAGRNCVKVSRASAEIHELQHSG